MIPYAGYEFCRMTREQIAEIIWRAEFRRATGKERSISWDELGETMKNQYLYLADAVLAGGSVGVA